ncbi:hypothetical protein HKD37_04G010027 [Glycine soja]
MGCENPINLDVYCGCNCGFVAILDIIENHNCNHDVVAETQYSFMFWLLCFLKPCFGLLTHDPIPSYFHVTVNDDQLWITLREPLELLIKEVSARYLLTLVEGNPKEKTSICVLLKTFAENFCACCSFFYDVVNRGAKLAASLRSYVEVKMSDEELAVLLSRI